MMKKNMKLNKLIALAVLMGGVSCCSSVWAAVTTIKITGNEGTAPYTVYSKTNGVGVDGQGASGTKSDIGNEVDKIVTWTGSAVGEITGEVYGIKVSSCSVAALSISGGIDVRSDSKAYGIYSDDGGISIQNLGGINAEGSGEVMGIGTDAGNNTIAFFGITSSITATSSSGSVYAISLKGGGTNSISGLGSVTALATGNNYAYGIYVKNENTAGALDSEFSVSFVSTGGSINAYSSDGDNYGIIFDSDSEGKSEVLNVKTLQVGFKDNGSGEDITNGVAYGIQAKAGVNTIDFTGTGSSIKVKSKSGNVYGIQSIGGTNTISNLGGIMAEAKNNYAAFGIDLNGAGNNNIVCSGNITAISESWDAYGISLMDNGTNKIYNLRSIIATSSDAGTACGIRSKNMESPAEDATFSVAFADTGGTIDAFSSSGTNYGIMFVKGMPFSPIATGKTEVLNVKTIEVGVDPADNTGNTITSGKAYGIQAYAGVNTVTFTGTDSSITMKSTGESVYGISLSGGTNTISGLGKITAEVNVSSGTPDAYGVSISGGTNEITFAGTGSSITANANTGNSYGISFGSSSTAATGTTKITGLGSIVSDLISDVKKAHGIYVNNGNSAGASDPVSFKVEFVKSTVATDGVIKAYAATGDNYGIKFNADSAGKSEVLNVKTIVAGVDPNNPTDPTKYSAGTVYGICAQVGMNTIGFTGAGSEITAKSSYEAQGIYLEDGTNYIGTDNNETTGVELGIITAEVTGTGVDNTAYGIEVNSGTNTVKFAGAGSSIKVKSGRESVGINLASGITTISGLGSITAISTGSDAYGIFAAGGTNNIAFDGTDSFITAKSNDSEANGIYLLGGENTIQNVGSIDVSGAGNAKGICIGDGEATIIFSGTTSTIIAKSSSGAAYGISLGDGTNNISGLATITATQTGSGDAYGIYANYDGSNTVSFKGNGGQAITTNSDGTTYSIYVKNSSSTTINFEDSILSGKIQQQDTATLELNFNNGGVWTPKTDDVTGTVTVNINNGGKVRFDETATLTTPLNNNGGTVEVAAKDVSVEKITGSAGADKYTFTIPTGIAKDGTEAMLNVTGTTALAFDVNDVITVNVINVASDLAIADKILLVNATTAMTGYDNITDGNKVLKNGADNWTEGKIGISMDNKQLILTVTGTRYVDVVPGTVTGNTVTVASVKEATILNGGVTSTVKFNDGEGTATSQDGPWYNVYGGWSDTAGTAVSGNTVEIKDGASVSSNVYGGYGTGDVTGNKVEINGGTFSKVYAGQSTAGDAKDNQVVIKSNNFSATAELYGGVAGTGKVSSGNTLMIDNTKDVTVAKVADFQNYIFNIPTGIATDGSETMLNITGVTPLTFNADDVLSVTTGDFAENGVITLIKETEGTFNLTGMKFEVDGETIDASEVNEYFKLADNNKSITFTKAVLDVDIKPVNKTSGNIVTVTGDRTGTVEGETIKTPKAGRNWKNVYGGYAENGDANNNQVTITAGTIKGNVYGGYSKTGNATGNFVTWESGTIGGELYGGYSGAAGKDVGNNWLKIVHKGETKTIKALNNFSSYVFDINTAKNNDTVLKITEKEITLLGGEYTVVVMDEQNEALKYEGTVCLIEDAKGIVDAGVTKNEVETSDGIVTTYGRYTIEDGKKLIYTKTSKMEADDGAKAPVEGMASAAATANTSSDLATGAGMANLLNSTSNVVNNTETFGAANIGKARYNTGSHVDASGYGIMAGVGKKVFDKKGNKTTGGLFFEYGNSNFDTYNTSATGSGKSIYKGGGYMMRWDNLSGNYYEGMLHAGKITTNWSNNSGGYNMNPTYYGAAATYGHKFMFGEKNQLSVYGSYIYSHTGGGDAMIGKYNYNFDATKSHRTKVGVRYAVSDLMDTKKFRPYVGLAWEHEFNGESGASVVGFGRTAAPSMKGDTGILELGFKQEVGKWTLGIGAEVFTGKRRGWNGKLEAVYNF